MKQPQLTSDVRVPRLGGSNPNLHNRLQQTSELQSCGLAGAVISQSKLGNRYYGEENRVPRRLWCLNDFEPG